MPLQRTTRMQSPLGFYVGRVREFWRGVQAAVVKPAICLNLGSPLATWFMQPDPKKPAGVVASRIALILGVDGWRGDAQVCNAVVCFDAVDVVKRASGPFAVGVQPSKPMRVIADQVNANYAITSRVGNYSNNVTGFVSAMTANRNYALKNASFRVVIEQFAQALRGKIVSSHDALLMLIGQRPTTIDTRLSASLF